MKTVSIINGIIRGFETRWLVWNVFGKLDAVFLRAVLSDSPV